jgi:acetylornithine deacetylase/succinyl-diaminopimelate desuccinylase-like protein
MDFDRLQEFIAGRWRDSVMGPLSDYIAIPARSPAFNVDWQANGQLDRAAEHLARWARGALVATPGALVEVLRLEGKTPTILIDVPGIAEAPPVILYGHLDKQPEMTGWSEGRNPWVPVVEADRLYGRGAADDGYAIFSAVLGILALRDQGLAYPRCLILIEGSEESGSGDLPDYVALMAQRLDPAPGLIVALDSVAGDYDRLWTTTSVRGQVQGVLHVRTLTAAVHSGDASGVAPAPLRVATRLLSRLEDPDTGEIVADFQVIIPEARRAQAEAASRFVDLGTTLSFEAGVRPVSDDRAELLLNRAWRAQLAVIGLDGLPSIEEAAAVIQPEISLKIGLRLPPTLDANGAADRLKALLEADPPYGSAVRFDTTMIAAGWEAPPLAPWLEDVLNEGSAAAFGATSLLFGGGGGIPFLAALAERFPNAQFLVTGVLGPESNAHGPNEFLHLPTTKRLTAVLAAVLNRTSALPPGGHS